MITQPFEDMLYLFGAGARGEKITFDHEIDVEQIYHLAISQGVWQTVFLALPESKKSATYKIPFLKNVTDNMRRNEFVLNTITKLNEYGIDCFTLKGMTIAKLYKEPSCRISGDVDIFIDKQDEKKAMKFLEEMGYTVEERGRNSHHFLAKHPVGGLLEVHVEMYSDPTKDILFHKKLQYNEEKILVDIDEKHQVKTFGINDGAIYMTAHYIKHFISKGVGVRQLMDLLLYLREYKKEIDWDHYYTIFGELRYEKLIKTLFAIGNRYFGMSFENFDEECMDMILSDTESGGVFGYNNTGLANFYEVFTQRRTSMSEKEYRQYMFTKRNASLIRRIFPLKTIMIQQGYQVRNCAELFIRYVQRLWRLMCSGIGKDNMKKKFSYYSENIEMTEEMSDRLAMMEQLQIL